MSQQEFYETVQRQQEWEEQMKSNTSGPAFPMSGFDMRHGQPVQAVYQHGMTLRDYFAAKAMHGWLSTYPTDHGPEEVYEDGVAEFAYRMADAMLKAREA